MPANQSSRPGGIRGRAWIAGAARPIPTRDHRGLAAVAVARGDARTAVRLLGATEQWRRTTGFRSEPFESTRADQTAAAARIVFGENAYRALAAEGARLELHDAVELALSPA